MLQTKDVEHIKIRVLYSVTLFPEIVLFVRECGKNVVEPVGHRWQRLDN